MITVVVAPPYLTVQDLGWRAYRAVGMPVGGAMDRWALQVANFVAGNAPDVAALEWALGGGALRFERDMAIAIAGASATATLRGAAVPACTTLVARRGDELRIERIDEGRFVYVAVRGGIAVPPLLGSRSTYLPARFGGLEGRRLAAGDRLPVGPAPVQPPPPEGFAVPSALRPRHDAARLRVIPGPQRSLVDAAEWARFLDADFTVSVASDRRGYRLEGVLAPTPSAPAALPSEPACPGAVQLPSGGAPIVLMPDGPTVGGYPKIAVVCAADLPVLAQRAPRTTVRFSEIDVREAQTLHRRRAIDLHTLAHLARSAR